MLRLRKNKKAQNTAEYAILIALVIGAVVAMQTYAQRTLQARVRDAAVQLVAQSTEVGNSLQYEPYYLNTRSQTSTDQTDLDTYQKQTRGKVVTKATASTDQTDYVNTAVDGSATSVVPADTGM